MDENVSAAQLAQQEIAEAQEASLMARLAQARSRIAELERTEHRLSAEIDGFRSQIVDAIRPLQASVSGHMIFAPARIEAIISSLTVVQRRDLWLDVSLSLKLPPRWEKLYPHDGGADRLRILVSGSGGYGDMLYLTMIVRALHERFDAPDIYVVHEHAGVGSVFSGNPYVASAHSANGGVIRELTNSAASLDIFDMIADVRYAVSYCAPPKSRIPSNFLIEASSKSVQWQKFCRDDWPFLNNIFAREIIKLGFNQYSFAEYTANLSFNNRYYGDIFPNHDLEKDVLLDLTRPYITIHHGSDKNMSGANGLQTKNLPDTTWTNIVVSLINTGFLVVQLGEQHETLVDGNVTDLRGRLSLGQTSLVLKHAQVHVDTEGGLVHLARAVGTKAVVAFGPTPPAFFGYAGNSNIAPGECGDCWWTTNRWATSCPREFRSPPCMQSHDAAKISKEAISLARRQKLAELTSIRPRKPRWAAGLAQTSQASLSVLAVVQSPTGLDAVREHAWSGLRVYAPPPLFASLAERSPIFTARPLHALHIGEASDSIDEAIAEIAGSATSGSIVNIIAEFARIVRTNGTFILSFSDQTSLTFHDVVSALDLIPGGRTAFKIVNRSDNLAGQDLCFSVGEGILPITLPGKKIMGRIFGPKHSAKPVN